MFVKISNDDFVRWESVEAVSFKRHEGLLIGAGLILNSGRFLEATGDYAVSIWEKMFPTRPPHDEL